MSPTFKSDAAQRILILRFWGASNDDGNVNEQTQGSEQTNATSDVGATRTGSNVAVVLVRDDVVDAIVHLLVGLVTLIVVVGVLDRRNTEHKHDRRHSSVRRDRRDRRYQRNDRNQQVIELRKSPKLKHSN
jgi:hypothetical protein